MGRYLICRTQAGRGGGPDTDKKRKHRRGAVGLAIWWGEGYKGVLTHEIPGTPRTHRGTEPHGQTFSGRANTIADGIWRGPRFVLPDKVRELTNSNEWSEQDIWSRGSVIFDIMFKTRDILCKHDDSLVEPHDEGKMHNRLTHVLASMHVLR